MLDQQIINNILQTQNNWQPNNLELSSSNRKMKYIQNIVIDVSLINDYNLYTLKFL